MTPMKSMVCLPHQQGDHVNTLADLFATPAPFLRLIHFPGYTLSASASHSSTQTTQRNYGNRGTSTKPFSIMLTSIQVPLSFWNGIQGLLRPSHISYPLQSTGLSRSLRVLGITPCPANLFIYKGRYLASETSTWFTDIVQMTMGTESIFVIFNIPVEQ